tara:strand:+ start:3493 stop:4116 length:624 start_codon:yes stop_codon:yes gene_type:complete
MSIQSQLKTLSAIALTILLSGCASSPASAPPQVQLAEDITVELPLPEQLGYSLTASQLINATWRTSSSQRSEQLPVQLQVGEEKLVLAGFSSWGTRILSLDYQGKTITTDVLAGLNGVLPQPEQVLFNLMITLWPSSAWEAPLNKVRWQLIDDGNSRVIFDSQGEKVIDIQYSSEDKLAGDIRFHQLSDDYTITIKTLQYSKTPLTP